MPRFYLTTPPKSVTDVLNLLCYLCSEPAPKQTPNLPTPKLRTPIFKLPSSNFDLSGLASLRETSVIQRREQIFTRRRKGAKRSEVRVTGQTFATRLDDYHAKAV